VYSIHVVANSTGQATNPCGPIIVANYLMHIMEKFQFHYAMAYSAPVGCKNWV